MIYDNQLIYLYELALEQTLFIRESNSQLNFQEEPIVSKELAIAWREFHYSLSFYLED